MESLVKKPKKLKKKPITESEDANENYSLAKWLDKNSLIRLKLTIVDALGPTVVKQNIKHIDYLDSYVTSKVWNDVSLTCN